MVGRYQGKEKGGTTIHSLHELQCLHGSFGKRTVSTLDGALDE